MNCPDGCWHTTNHSPTWMNLLGIVILCERLKDPRLSCIICYMLYIGYVIMWYVYNIFSPLIWKFCWKLLFIFTWYNNRWFMSNLCVRFCQIFSPIILYTFSSTVKGVLINPLPGPLLTISMVIFRGVTPTFIFIDIEYWM